MLYWLLMASVQSYFTLKRMAGSTFEKSGRCSEKKRSIVLKELPKSGFEKSSKHDAKNNRFLEEVAAKIDALLEEKGSNVRLAVVAPPETMGALRSLFSEMVRNRIVKELLHDYTRTPHERLEQLITKSL